MKILTVLAAIAFIGFLDWMSTETHEAKTLIELRAEQSARLSKNLEMNTPDSLNYEVWKLTQ